MTMTRCVGVKCNERQPDWLRAMGRSKQAESLLTQVSLADRNGAGCIEKELLALFGYALTGSSPFGLAHMGLRIPVP